MLMHNDYTINKVHYETTHSTPNIVTIELNDNAAQCALDPGTVVVVVKVSDRHQSLS